MYIYIYIYISIYICIYIQLDNWNRAPRMPKLASSARVWGGSTPAGKPLIRTYKSMYIHKQLNKCIYIYIYMLTPPPKIYV